MVTGMAVVTVSSKGQITLPKEIRDAFGIEKGSKLQVLAIGEQLILISIPKDPIKALKGSIKLRRPITEIIREMREEEKPHGTALQKVSEV